MARTRTRAARKSVARGAKILSGLIDNPRFFRAGKGGSVKPKVVTIRFDSKMSRKDFRTKADSLRRLSREGRLRKTPVKRDPQITRNYRGETIRKLTGRHRGNRAEQRRIAQKFSGRTSANRAGDGLDPDHIHELQLGGRDHADNLRWMDAYTNRTIGSQIASQLRGVPDGTPVIIRVLGY
ncbi:hypothetical protein [Glycomyces rhizosphaerae]|uniref:HNH endonuclease n=1 Tax=Glycomyces rhizosphaerae TaxID=2054422 RepID=A0ABV7PYW9_9ACTN